jgi:hypothetical protein
VRGVRGAERTAIGMVDLATVDAVVDALFVHAMIEAGGTQPGVTLPTVGVDGRAGEDAVGDERPQRVAGGVGQRLHAQTSRAAAANLNGNADKRFAMALAAAA